MIIASHVLGISADSEWKSSSIRIAYVPMNPSTFSGTLHRARTTILKRLFFDRFVAFIHASFMHRNSSFSIAIVVFSHFRNNVTVEEVMVPEGVATISRAIHADRADLSSVPMPMQEGDNYINHFVETIPLRLVENKLLRPSRLISDIFSRKFYGIGLSVVLLAIVFRGKGTFGSRSIGCIALALIGTIFGQGHAIFARRAPAVFGIYLFACLLLTTVLRSQFTSKVGETSISRHTSLRELREAINRGECQLRKRTPNSRTTDLNALAHSA